MSQESTEDSPMTDRRIRLEKRLKAREGTSYEMVQMVEGGKLILQVLEYLPGGAMTEGEIEIEPNTKEFHETLLEHGPLEIGQGHTIKRIYNGSAWVRVPDAEVDPGPDMAED